MTDDERAARKWLSKVFILGSAIEECRKHRATILRLLERPVLPRGEDVSEETVERMWKTYHHTAHVDGKSMLEGMRAALDMLREHLTAPPPAKKVEAWAVVWADGTRQAFFEHQYAQREANRCPGSRVVKLVEAADDQ